MLKADWAPYILKFKQTVITSRERMDVKQTYLIKIYEEDDSSRAAIGECAVFRGLSAEDSPMYEHLLDDYCRQFNTDNSIEPSPLSSIRFGFETAFADLDNGCKHVPFRSEWSEGRGFLVINGLVWMGTVRQMFERACEKIDVGFGCIKMKIGGCDFESEIELLSKVRKKYADKSLTIRLDANGAFTPENALERLERLSKFQIHSLEQPIKAGGWKDMAKICRESPIPIALDEELIGIDACERKEEVLDEIKPAFIILKPSLCGGFSGAADWIGRAEKRKIGWWVTSALESAVGLNAISSWTATLGNQMPQGLGTGQLYLNDFQSPLRKVGDRLYCDPTTSWKLPKLDWQIYG